MFDLLLELRLTHWIDFCQLQIRVLEENKRREWRKERPNLGLIAHWQAEIDNWKRQIKQAEVRLKIRRIFKVKKVKTERGEDREEDRRR
jgi:hypothetical protein